MVIQATIVYTYAPVKRCSVDAQVDAFRVGLLQILASGHSWVVFTVYISENAIEHIEH